MKKIALSFWTWLAALAVVVVIAVVATPHIPVAQQRISYLESIVRCPACVGLSVRDSQNETSIVVRHQIVARVRAGASDTMILRELENQYGVGILLSPDAGGLGYLLWVVPIGVVVCGVGIYFRLVRRS